MASATDGENHATSFLYDGNGNRTSLTDRRGKTYTFGYDGANRPTTTTTPAGKTTTVTYLGNGLAETIQEPSGQTTTFAYNGKNLVSSKTDPSGTIAYGYDDGGLLETVTEGTDVITRTYDERGRLKSLTTADGDLLQYRYDANGNLTKLIYPDGRDVDYTYNARNLLETVTDWGGRVTAYSYDRIGRLTGVARPNGTGCAMTYDAAGQEVERRETGAGGRLFSYLRFGYDAAGQIGERFRAPLFNSGWQHPDVAATYDDDNRLLTFGGLAVSHDDDGNMTHGPVSADSGALNLTYNSRNQLTAAGGLTYTYDAEGRRRTTTGSTGTTRDVMDPNAPMSRLLVRHHPGGGETYYVYGIGLLYEVDAAENTKTYHFDQVGSAIARTGDAGEVIGRAEYSAYGLLVRADGDMGTPFLYNGQWGIQTDANGLLNMRARYYSPYLMRFLNADPIGFSGGQNWFAYADGNPVSMSDPFGLAAQQTSEEESYGFWDFLREFCQGIGGGGLGDIPGLHHGGQHLAYDNSQPANQLGMLASSTGLIPIGGGPATVARVEALAAGQANSLSSTYRMASPLARAEARALNRLNFNRASPTIVRVRTTQLYSQATGAPINGYYNQVTNQIFLGRGSNLGTLTEELIHAGQRFEYGGQIPPNMIPLMEIQAEKMLLRLGFEPVR